MVSKRRDDLRDYMEENYEFIATVEDSNYSMRRVIVTDVAIVDADGTFRIVSPHLHLRNVDDKILKRLRFPDIIIFKATACRYEKSNRDELYRNFALENVRNIKKVRGVYDVK